jgi:transposase
MSEKSELSAALKLEIADQLSRDELVKIVLTQQKLIEKLQQELEKLKQRQPSNSFTSSKPPSSDLIQKSELAKVENLKESEPEPKRQQGKSISIRLDTRDEKNLKSCKEKPN